MAQTARSMPGRIARPPQPKPERHLHLLKAVGDELHHLHEIEEEGETGAAALIVLGQVMLTLLVVVSVEMAVAMAFYFGWL
jgi:hypothetical protein